jgi:hypothetical protein
MTDKKSDEREVSVVLLVDPKSLGMTGQAGEAPPAVKDELPPPELKPGAVSPRLMSLNEPPGSNVLSKSVVEPFTGKSTAKGKSGEKADAMAAHDRDDIEGEIEDAVDDGDVEIKPKKKR